MKINFQWMGIFLQDGTYFCHCYQMKKEAAFRRARRSVVNNSRTTYKKFRKMDYSYLQKVDLCFDQNCSHRVFSFGHKVAFLHKSE